MNWRVAKSLLVLRDQLDRAFPNRSRASDGTIGDADHLADGWTDSDHNPWYPEPNGGIVTAIDITHDPANGVDIDRLSDELAESRDPRIKYIIANRWILDSRPKFDPWQWVAYHGSNPHTKHLHLSVKDSPICDNETPWNLPMITGENMTALTIDERNALYDVREQLTGGRPVGVYPGWPAREDISDKPKTLVDYVRATHFELTKRIDARDAGPTLRSDTMLGHAASAHGQVVVLRNETTEYHQNLDRRLDGFEEKLDEILAKLDA